MNSTAVKQILRRAGFTPSTWQRATDGIGYWGEGFTVDFYEDTGIVIKHMTNAASPQKLRERARRNMLNKYQRALEQAGVITALYPVARSQYLLVTGFDGAQEQQS